MSVEGLAKTSSPFQASTFRTQILSHEFLHERIREIGEQDRSLASQPSSVASRKFDRITQTFPLRSVENVFAPPPPPPLPPGPPSSMRKPSVSIDSGSKSHGKNRRQSRHSHEDSPVNSPLPGEVHIDIPYSPTSQQSLLPPPEENALLQDKLKHPQKELKLDESIQLLTECIQYGKIQAGAAQGKQAIIFLGNTGAGKSTTVNYLFGCTMELKTPKELGIKSPLRHMVVVRPTSMGGKLKEVMPIGHTKESKTFMPHIETDSVMDLTYCDCPGFLDNRGAEINIANAVNVKNAIGQANTVKVIMLINYHTLLADRGRGLTDMLKISLNLFGKAETLIKYRTSILIGISNTPLDMPLEQLKEWIAEDDIPIMNALAERIFIFDPLDRPMVGGFSRREILTRIQSLVPIDRPSRIFNTVLTDEDENKLLRISEEMGSRIQKAIEAGDYKQAADYLARLQELSIIEHPAIERLIAHNRQRIHKQFAGMGDAFKECCWKGQLDKAPALLMALKQALDFFDKDMKGRIDLSELEHHYQECQSVQQEQLKKEQEIDAKLRAANQRIEELIELLEQQKHNTEAQLEKQKENFDKVLRDMEKAMESRLRDFAVMKKEIIDEMERRMAQKKEEIQVLGGGNKEEVDKRIQEENAILKRDYDARLQALEQEKAKFEQEQIAKRQIQEREMQAEQARLQERIQKLAAEKQKEQEKLQVQAAPARVQPASETQITMVPNALNEKANLGWRHYYGIGVTKNLALAAQYFQNAADQGEAAAYYLLARCYLRGEGVTKDPARGLALRKQAAKLPLESHRRAIGFFEAAAAHGSMAARQILGRCYIEADGVEKNLERALQLMESGQRSSGGY